MKSFFIVLVFFYLINSVAFSDSLNSPASPSVIQEGFLMSDSSWINFRLGMENDIVFDETMQFKRTYKNANFHSPKIKSRTSDLTVFCNIKERLDIYAKIGKSLAESEFQQLHSYYYFKSKPNLFYEMGAKLLLIEIKSYSFSLDFNYFYFSSSSSFLLQNQIPQPDYDLKYSLKGWQIGVLVGKTISYFVPYFGISIKNSKIRFEHFPYYNNNNVSLHDKHREGLVIGTSFSPFSYIMLNAEVRLINQSSIAFSGSLRF